MTCNRAFPFIMAVSAAIIAAPAQAQSVDDVRCLLVSNAASKLAKDPNEKRLTDATLHFYLGRIDGKYNETQLAAAFATQIKSLVGVNVGPTMQACFQYAQQRMKVVQGVGEQLNRTRKQ